MVFADLYFLYFFLPICLICYFVAKKIDTRNTILIIFSIIFYAWGEPLWVFLLIFSAFWNYFCGRMIGKYRNKGNKAKLYVAAGIVLDLLLLVIFKYTGFLTENLNALLHTSIPVPNITLPIGISFFTFQAISYILDCYWETVEPQKKFKKFLMYLSLFPQLIAGPIVRYSTIAEEIDNRRVTATDLSEGAIRVIMGIGKKVIIANNLWTIVDTFFGSDISKLSFLGTWFTVIVYSLYVYFDFSGYSDIAIGMGRMFGFHFDENFRYPFICKNISEFWQRWHISLGSFFRDYLLYVPIFGKSRKYFGLFLVWFCTGLWHGASWNFVFWGLYFGLFIFLELKIGKKRMKKWPKVLTHIYSKLVIIIGFGIFYFEDLGQLGTFFGNITGINMITKGIPFWDILTYNAFINNIILIAVAILACFPVVPQLKKFFFSWGNNNVYAVGKIASTVAAVFVLVISSILLVDATNNPFLYFRF